MASSDYFTRPAIRSSAVSAAARADSPKTPLLNRSISSQFGTGSPSSFRAEQAEEHIIYELGARHLSAGFAGESRPRCIHLFNPEDDRRVGDYRAVDPAYRRKRRKVDKEDDAWGREYELYRCDLRSIDLGLAEDRLERAVRKVHEGYLQLDQKPKKAVLVIQSLLPTPLVEVALKVLFQHYAQPGSVSLLTMPVLACLGGGVRCALVVDVGWEEVVATAVGEYKEVAQRRSVRAGKAVVREMAGLLEEEVSNQLKVDNETNGDDVAVTFPYAEEVTRRMCWCRPRDPSTPKATTEQPSTTGMIKLPSPSPDDPRHIHIPFTRLSKPAETALFVNPTSPSPAISDMDDDHNLTLPTLAYRVLLSLPLDLRALCTSRIIITGGLSSMPGLKQRFLQDLTALIDLRGWDPVHSYGSATAHHNSKKALLDRSANIASQSPPGLAVNGVEVVASSPTKKLVQDSIAASQRVHDDLQDPVTKKVETELRKGQTTTEVVKGVVRGVETLGAWAGASLMASMRVKGVHEIEREEFLKNGLNEFDVVI